MNVLLALNPPSLVRAATDGRHRPASHPVLSGVPRAGSPSPSEPLSGWRIRAKRIVRGWSQDALAERMGVSRPAVAQWESDSYRPTAEHAERLRELLG